MKKEIWKKIKGFEEYSVSSTGHVKRVIQARNKQKLKEKYLGFLSLKGYQTVVLYKKGKRYSFQIHHLVLETFGSPRPEAHECNHINADRADNRIENLEWVTSSENRRHCMKLGRAFFPKGEQAGRAKLKEKDVYKIRELLKTNKYYLHEIGKMFGVKTHAIWAIKKGRNWKHLK